MENETEKKNIGNDIESEIKEYQKKLLIIQEKINELTTQRDNLYKTGLRIEGIIGYLQEKGNKS